MQAAVLLRERGLRERGPGLLLRFTVPKVWQRRAVCACQAYSCFLAWLGGVCFCSWDMVRGNGQDEAVSILLSRPCGWWGGSKEPHHCRGRCKRVTGDKLERFLLENHCPSGARGGGLSERPLSGSTAGERFILSLITTNLHIPSGGGATAIRGPLFPAMFSILKRPSTWPIFSKWLLPTHAHLSRNRCLS